MHSDVRKMTEGAIFIALLSVLFIVDRLTGFQISLNFVFFLPIFIYFYTNRNGLKYGMICTAALLFILVIVSGSLPVIISSGFYSVLGLVLYILRRRINGRVHRALILWLCIVFIYYIQIQFFSVFFGVGPAYDLVLIDSFVSSIGPLFGLTLQNNLVLDWTLMFFFYAFMALCEVFILTRGSRLFSSFFDRWLFKTKTHK